MSAGAASMLAACGSGTIESALVPTRFISFGDSFSDLGQSGNRYTVNDNTVNIWSSQLATNYAMTVAAVANGGQGYAQGNARVTVTPDAAGKTTTLTVTQQIDKFLAAGGTFGLSDVVLINGGISDVVAEMAAVTAGTSNSTQMVANVGQAGANLATQIQRLVKAGAKYVLVAGLYNMAKSPWAIALNQTVLIGAASARFNEQLLVNIVSMGTNVLYVDAAYYLNLVTSTPTAYGLLDATTVVCTSTDATNGIGIGAGNVNAALCTTSTITTGLDYTKYAFADPVNFTPTVHILFGNYAYTRLRARW